MLYESSKKVTVTYGGKRRIIRRVASTIRESPPEDQDGRLEAEIQDVLYMKQDDSKDANRKVDQESEDDEDGIRFSVHKLLEAGETSRFLDRINFLIEGLSSRATQSRLRPVRSRQEALWELGNVTVKSGHGFVSRIRAHGLMPRILGEMKDLLEAGDARIIAGFLVLLVQVGQEVRRLHDLLGSVEWLVKIVQITMLVFGSIEIPLKEASLLLQLTPFKHSNLPLCYSQVGLWLISKIAISQSDLRLPLMNGGIGEIVFRNFMDSSVESFASSVTIDKSIDHYL